MGQAWRPMMDRGDYPVIYSDGIGEIHEAGGMSRLTQFVWEKVDGVWCPVRAAIIIRPRATVTESAFRSMQIALQMAPAPEDVTMFN